MANTYTLIATGTPTSGTSFSFTSIPQTYTDLVVLGSVKNSGTGTVAVEYIQFNSDTATNYSRTTARGTGTTAISQRNSNGDVNDGLGYVMGNGATVANTFSSFEFYIPNYTITGTKQQYIFSVADFNTSTNNEIWASASYYRGTSAISTITFFSYSLSFVTGTSFYLYGIKNS